MGNGVIFLIIFLIFLVPLQSFADEVPICGEGTFPANNTGQCILLCGDGTENVDGECIKETDKGYFQGFNAIEEAIGVGVLVGISVAIFGVVWTVKTRNDEKKREDLEIIQNYGTQLSEIVKTEQDLETKSDCAIYVERYLDTLEQVASLNYQELLRRNVADYFENHFSYGINLWRWYKEYVEKIPKEMLESEWKKGVDKNKTITENEKYEGDRWFYFRWWCEETDTMVVARG